MRGLVKALGAVLIVLSHPLPGLAEGPVPERRAVVTNDTDLPGGDLRTILDTTLEACERACLADTRCTAFTFNSRNGSCFPKSAPGEAVFYQGAYSARIEAVAESVRARAAERAGDLSFLVARDLSAARTQAVGLGREHLTGGMSAAELRQAAAASQSLQQAAGLSGAAAAITDAPADWNDYAARLMAVSRGAVNSNRSRALDFAGRAVSASVNGYLRAATPAERHEALTVMARGLEGARRGQQAVGALRLAQQVLPHPATAAELDRVAGLYGFRIARHDVQSEGARPRICAEFTENLIAQGLDYTPYVQLPQPGLTVEPGERRQLCVVGMRHGERITLTFREGLPAADGQTLARSVPITAYVRDRSPTASFPGRGYVLPRTGSASIPVQTVNTGVLDLDLFRVSDRNLLRAMQDSYFGTPIDSWRAEEFRDGVAEAIWTGTAEVAMEVNRDVTTRLPLDEAIAGLDAGIYALRAAVPGMDEYDNPPAWQWFVVSDLGITTMSGVDGLHVFVRRLGTAEAAEGAKVALVSRANRVLDEVETDAMGYARFPEGLTRGTGGAEPALVTVTMGEDGGDDIAFLSLSDPEFDLSDRGVEGREAAPPIDVFLTTDRGAYRAGETVFVTALARDSTAEAIEGLPLTARLRRPDGVEYSRQLAADSGAGGHVYGFPVAGNAPRGTWRVDILADADAAPIASRSFLVEDFLPERIDFDLALDDAPLRPGEVADLTVDARYLFGAPAGDLAIEGEVVLRAADGLAGFPGYRFGPADEPFRARMEPLAFGHRTGEDGSATLPVVLPEAGAEGGRPLEAVIRLRLVEGSGRPVERSLTRALEPAAPMVGIRPLFDGVVQEGAEARFAVIGAGAAGERVPMDLRWTLTRIETRYQWYQMYGSWSWEPVTIRNRVAEGEVATGTDPGQIAVPVSWGQYELAVERADGALAGSSVRFRAGWYAPADVSETPDTLELSLDKPAYAPGEVARLRIVPRAAGTALVTVLSSRLVAMEAVEVAEGENIVELPVTDDWGAGVYVTASVLRPMDAAAGRMPARALGLAHASIDPGRRHLPVEIVTAPEAEPRGPLDIGLRVEGVGPGETAYVTVAAVDLGILNLTGFASPDPAGHYFGQRRLGVGIRDIYGRLIDGMSGAEGRVRSGGDAAQAAGLQAPPPTEELVAYFTGPVQVAPDGTAQVSFDLPAFNGTVRVMAVAWSQSGVGQAEADVLVTDPVVVAASLPRFLSPGDESRLRLEMTHARGPAGAMALEAVAEGAQLGAVPEGFDLAEGGRAVIEVPVSAEAAGLGRISVAVTTPEGRRLGRDLMLPVQAGDPAVTRTSRFDLAQGQTFTLGPDAFAGLVPGTGRVTVAAGQIARFDTPGLLSMLDRYPYGCTEQITSRALPLLYLDQVARAMDLPGADNLGERIGRAIEGVLLNQTSEGGFGVWRASHSGDLWLGAYVTDFLSRARAQGHAVPDPAFQSALDNLRNRVNYMGDFERGGGDLAYALMVLAREGAAAVGDLRYYADVKGDAFDTPIAAAQLGAALASYGDQVRADAMFARAARMVRAEAGPEEAVWRSDYGTRLRDSAAVLALATEAGSEAVDRALLAERIGVRAGERALSTQEAAWMLLATHALIDRPGAEGLVLNDAPVTGPLVQVLESEAAQPVAIRNDAARTTMLTVTTYGVPEVPEPAGGNGYAIERLYYTLEGEPFDGAEVAVGTRLVTVLEITPFGRGEARLIVADPLPAGFEIDNPNLIRGGDIGGLDWLGLESDVAHSEFRQDRFITAIDRRGPQPFRLAYIVRAVTPGAFHHPAASVEDMYRPEQRAHGATGRVIVVE
ncbi:MAG: alpha-2-macroglobulin family protein [Gemmobacter sp.]